MLDKGQAIGARLARGDESALEDAYAAYSCRLLSFLRRYVGADEADVRTAVRRLPDHEREVIELAYFRELTQREIASALDVPLGTVKARAARGTRRLSALVAAG